MTRQSRIKQVSGRTVELTDGSRWEVTDFSAPIELPMWMAVDEIEAEVFGLDAHLINKRREKTLKAKLLR